MSHAKEKVAVFGQGIIGSRVARRLHDQAYEVTTWNRSPDKAEINPLNSAASAASEARVLLFFLKDGAALRDVFEQIEDQLHPEHILVNHSTVDLETTHWLAKKCSDAGCGFLDCPFTGSKLAAENGGLVYYVGGPEVLLDRMSTLLDVSAKQVLHIGKAGDATIIKIVTNLISAATVQALAEANAITNRLGLPSHLLREAVAANACGSLLAGMKLEAIDNKDFEPHFSLENMRKDSQLAKQLAAQGGTRTPVTDTTYACLEALCNKGYGELDYGALAKAFDH